MKVIILLTFLTIFTPFIQPAPAKNSTNSPSMEMLGLGQKLMKQERWEEAKQQFAKINKSKHGVDRLVKAEANFSYGLCLEKLGNTNDAIKVYNAVIAVYGSYVTWSSQALERGFNLAYKAKEPEKKINAYRYLRKILYMFQNFQEADDSSGALSRTRKRQAEVVKELGLTPEQQRDIDVKLGIIDE